MKIVLNIAAVLAILVGGVWFLQGINVLLGSVMSGQPLWLVIGLVLVAAGIATLLVVDLRKKNV